MLTPSQITEIYDQYADYVFRYFFSHVNSKEVAEDLTSQTFFKLVDKSDKFDIQKSSPKTWLFNIAKNTLIDFYRRADRRKNRAFDDNLDENIDLSSNNCNKEMELSVQLSRNKEILSKIIITLDEEEQKIIFLRFTQEYSYDEIASELEISVNKVGVKLHRIIGKMRRKLKKDNLIDHFDL